MRRSPRRIALLALVWLALALVAPWAASVATERGAATTAEAPSPVAGALGHATPPAPLRAVATLWLVGVACATVLADVRRNRGLVPLVHSAHLPTSRPRRVATRGPPRSA
jgi:hypothetical protein